ncbi:MAG: SH3 domain-containing protein [Sulfurimonas sp.]|nr:SH3 domain-containing protein [Sulfurimonas sp.]
MKKALFFLVVGISSCLMADSQTEDVVMGLIKSTTANKTSIHKLNSSTEEMAQRISFLEKKLAELSNSDRTINKDGRIVEVSQLPINTREEQMPGSSIVLTWGLNLREEPTANSRIGDVFTMGQIINISTVTNGWAKTKNGFVSAKAIDTLLGNIKKVKPKCKNFINIRKFPVLASDIVSVATSDEELLVFKKPFSSHWYKIIGREGFVSSSSVKDIE